MVGYDTQSIKNSAFESSSQVKSLNTKINFVIPHVGNLSWIFSTYPDKDITQMDK